MPATKRKRDCDCDSDCDSQESTANNMSHSGSIDVDTEELLRQMALVKFAIHPSIQFKSWDDEAMWYQIIKDTREKNGRNPTLITVLETVIGCHDCYISNPSMSSFFAKLVFGNENVGFNIECIKVKLGCFGKQMASGKRTRIISENSSSANVTTLTNIVSYNFNRLDLDIFFKRLHDAEKAIVNGVETANRIAERAVELALTTQRLTESGSRDVMTLSRRLSHLHDIELISMEQMAVASHLLKSDSLSTSIFLSTDEAQKQVRFLKKLMRLHGMYCE